MLDCIFCAIVAGQAPATVVREWDDAMAIVPLGPVVAGHILVLPKQHVRDFGVDPAVSAATMRRAAEIAPHPANIITSLGREATQSVWHLHVHIVPRAEDDGLALPWYSGKRSRGSAGSGSRPAPAREPGLVTAEPVKRMRGNRGGQHRRAS